MSRLFTLQEVNDLELSAVEAERERIIKLLEEQKAIECKKAVCGTIFDGHDYECLSEVIDCYIALIKGETK